MIETESRRRRLSLPKKLLLAFALLLASVLLLECLSRVLLLVLGKEQRPYAVKSEILDLKSTLTERTPLPEKAERNTPPKREGKLDLLHPYYGMENIGGIRVVSRFPAWFRRPDRSGDYFILVVGGSVAARFAELSWGLFTGVVEKDPRFWEKKIRLIHFARGGFKQPQQATILAYLLSAGLRPDAVINIDGFNEVALGFDNANYKVNPLYPSVAHWGLTTWAETSSLETFDLLRRMRDIQIEAGRIADGALKLGMHFSGILGRYTVHRLKQLQKEYVEANDRYLSNLAALDQEDASLMLRGPEFLPEPEYVADLIKDSWVQGSLSIWAMCSARSIPYLHVLQPTLHDDGSKALTEEEVRKGTAHESWIAGVKLGYPRLREKGKELEERGVHFMDCSMIFRDVKETLYFDACHFEGVGHEIFSRAVAEAFLEALPPQ